MSLTIQRPSIPVPLPLARGGTDATTAAGARTTLELGDLALLTAPGGTTTFLRADKTWAVPAAGGGAPTDAEYITSTVHASLSAERVLTDTATITWDRTTAGQIKANASGGGSYTDEQAQDAIGAMLVDSATIDLTYTDAMPSLSASVIDGSITEAKLSLSDVTTKDASITAHGLLRKLSGTSTQYLDGSGAWTTPAGGGGEWTRNAGGALSLATGLLAFWRMEETSGTRVDSVGGLALVPAGTTGNISQQAGITAQAVGFGGSCQLTLTDNATLSAGTASFTLACWVYLNAITGDTGLVGKGNGAVSNGMEYLLLRNTSNRFAWQVGNGAAANQELAYSSVTPTTGTWYLLVGWYDATADLMWLQVNNGTPVSAANANGSFDSTHAFEVGRFPTYAASGTLNGRVDNVMWWRRTLTAQERADLWNGGAGLDYAAIAGSPAFLRPTTSTDGVLAGATTRTATEPLESAGGLKLGTTTGTIDGTLRWTGTDFEGRKGGAWVSMTSGGGQPLDATLTALAGLATGADQLPYATGTDTFAQTPLTAFARTLLDDTTQAAMRSTLGLTPGTDVQAQDAELSAIAGLASVADRVPYFTGAGTAALATFTAAGRTLAGAADAVAQRTALALGTMAQQDAASVAITGGSVTGLTALSTTAPGDIVSGRNLTANNQLFVTGTTQLANNVGLRTAPAGNIALDIRYAKGSAYGIVLQPSDSDTGVTTAQLFSNLAGTPVGSISTTASATSFTTSSDVRLKHAITALTGALDVVQALRPVKFRWNADDSLDIGFLGHELQREVPTAASGEPDAVNEDGSVKPMQVDHSKIVPILVSAVKELLARVEVLEQALA